MVVTLKETDSEKERLEKIHSAYRSLGIELHDLCQKSKNIEPEIKEKQTKEICVEYCRQAVKQMIGCFSSCEMEIKMSDNNAIELAGVVKAFSEKEYQELLEQCEHYEMDANDKINSL